MTAAPAALHGTVRNHIPARGSDGGNGLPATPAARLQTAIHNMPKAGDEFVGFKLVKELGRGSFGRVFLAAQKELGGRPVALKVSADLTGESRTLARLQHTNIVPVYSVHHDGVLQAVCMPYFGRTTLADVISRCRSAPTLPATGLDLVNTLKGGGQTTRPNSHPDAAPRPDSALPPDEPDTRTDAVFARLARMSYPEAVCWLVERAADGLAHAHERGVLHRDVKPANVLLTDDGQPMLLDFGVAEELAARATAAGGRAGGTIPYMAPEHLAEVRGDGPGVDHRSDIYSLGVVLFELLTGRHPFRQPPAGAELDAELPALLAERQAWVPDVRRLNPAVPADLEAVVRTCVAADPARRYQSAADLRDDLERHRRNEPLRVAPEPGVGTRARKWMRRHPRAAAQLAVTAGVIAALALSVGTIEAWKRLDAERAERAERDGEYARQQAAARAARTFADFQADFRRSKYLLAGQVTNPVTRTSGIARMTAAVDRYRPADPGWHRRPAVADLPADTRAELRVALAEAYLFLARGVMTAAPADPDRLADAARYNRLAEAVLDGSPPRAVLVQRAELLAQLDEAEAAAAAERVANATPLVTADDHYLQAHEWSGKGRYADAVPLFRKAVTLDPAHYWAHFGLGFAYAQTGRPADARGCYTAAIALRPEFVWAYRNRGLAALNMAAFDDAVADLDRVVDLEPDFLPARLDRAQALDGAGNRRAALADLAVILDEPDTAGLHVRAYLLRARVRRALGDATGAAADADAGFRITPTDEVGWLVRAHARLDSDPAAALADLERAVKLNPKSIAGWQNTAYILDKQRRDAECLPVLDRLIELAPGVALYRGGRAVLLARTGRTDEAVRVVTEVVARQPTASTLYQATSVYSLASRTRPEHKAEAMRYLTACVRSGQNLDELRADKDLDPLRDEPEFRTLVPDKK